ncbi:MAG: hypothetical protein KDN22_23730 [Verrucomicrobiae bacterium]|nr:hypothetical protein [Verrucomicrobiae bacterium]
MDTFPSEPIYESTGGNADELARAIRVCLMGGDIHLPLTCMVGAGDELHLTSEWDKWRGLLFAKILAPHLIGVFTAAHRGDVREIMKLDQALAGQLAEDVAERSVNAGSQFYASMDGARHIKTLEKLRTAVLEQKIAGHHATFFAAEAAVFHVPMMHLLPAYLYAEWRSARLQAGMSVAGSSFEAFRAVCQGALVDAGKIFSDVIGGQHSLGVCA